MSKKSWCFSSTIEAFDGERIVREAEAMGAVVLRVEREGAVREYIHESLHRRALRVGFPLYLDVREHSEHIPRLYRGALDDYHAPNSLWCSVPEGVSAQAKYEELKAYEARRAKTTVEIITEDK